MTQVETKVTLIDVSANEPVTFEAIIAGTVVRSVLI